MHDQRESAFYEKANDYKRKMTITKELVNVTKSFYIALQKIANLDRMKLDQFEQIKTFTTKFYNKDCIYRGYVDELKQAIELEMNEIKRQLGFFTSMVKIGDVMQHHFNSVMVG